MADNKTSPLVSEYSEDFLQDLKLSQTLGETFLQRAKEQGNNLCFADSLGREVSYRQAMIASILLAKYFNDRGMGKNVGILMPSSVGGALANIALTLTGRVTVNINFTASVDGINFAIRQADIGYVVTSRKFMDRLGFQLKVSHIIYLEDVMEEIKSNVAGKIWAAVQALLLPTKSLMKMLGAGDISPQDVVTIIFSSGTTGDPKGVMLTHQQIMENVTAVINVFPHDKNDNFMGVLPFFHSFGYMATLWLPLLMRVAAIYHPDPTDAKAVGKMVQKYKASFIMGTPTFYRLYEKRCKKSEFASLKYAIGGAEKLHTLINERFESKFGIPILEGYGCTELGPAVAVNRPNLPNQTNYRPGSVGRPLPHVHIKVLHQETGEELSVGEEGVVHVKSPAMMQGYLNLKTDKISKDGWYSTGDIGYVDEDGFLFITDRLERFSKIGGEMVPHMAIEDVIKHKFDFTDIAIVAVAHMEKGEQLVALYAHETLQPKDIAQALRESDLPKLWQPKEGNIFHIDALPILGSGKLNLNKLKMIAAEKV